MVTGSVQAADVPRAVKGQTVQVVLDHIKGDKREQFEHIYDLFWHHPSVWPTEDQAVRDNSRLLYPTEANEDGTYTYAWIFDPRIEGGEYNIHTLMKKIFGDELGEEYFQQWVDAHASDQDGYLFVQT